MEEKRKKEKGRDRWNRWLQKLFLKIETRQVVLNRWGAGGGVNRLDLDGDRQVRQVNSRERERERERVSVRACV